MVRVSAQRDGAPSAITDKFLTRAPLNGLPPPKYVTEGGRDGLDTAQSGTSHAPDNYNQNSSDNHNSSRLEP